MGTDAVSTTAGARDARTAASGLAKPVPDGRCRAAIVAWRRRLARRTRCSSGAPAGARQKVSAAAAALGRGRRPLTPALLGVG